MQKLRCTNEECPSHVDDTETPVFTVNMTVDGDGDVCEPAYKIPGKYFVCCFCESEAEWV